MLRVTLLQNLRQSVTPLCSYKIPFSFFEMKGGYWIRCKAILFMILTSFYILTFFQFSYTPTVSGKAHHSMKSILFQYLLISIVTTVLLNLIVYFQFLALTFFSISPPHPVTSLGSSLTSFLFTPVQ